MVDEGSAPKKIIATEVLDVVRQRNVDRKCELARVRKRKQREKEKKQETENDKETRLRCETERIRNFRKQETEIHKETRLRLNKERSKIFRTRQKDPESKLKENKRRCSERLKLRNVRKNQEVKDENEENDDIKHAVQEALRDLHRTKEANNPRKH